MIKKRFEIWKINSKKNGVKDTKWNAYYSLEDFLDWLNHHEPKQVTNKRFTLHLPIDENGTMGYIVDNRNNTTYFFNRKDARKDLVNLLNELNEENEELQDFIRKGWL